MSYETAIQTTLLATHCCVCGRPLVDATSVELGIGPDCRNQYAGGIDDKTRIVCNKLTFQAAMAAQAGNLTAVREIAKQVEDLGLKNLADKILTRFKNVEKKCKITIVEKDGILYVNTPYKRSYVNFPIAWQNIPGRRFVNGQNRIPVAQKRALWDLLKRIFPGEWMQSGKGFFRIPDPEETEN